MSSGSEDGPAGGVPLAAAIQSLRQELKEAWSAGSGDWLKFRPSPVELTMQVAVSSSGKVGGGVKWWLIEFGGEASRESAVTQTIKVTLDPVIFDTKGEPTDLLIDAPDTPGGDDTSDDDMLDAPA